VGFGINKYIPYGELLITLKAHSEISSMCSCRRLVKAVVADKVCGEVESTKSVSEIFAPVSGKIVAINEALNSAPETINSDPYGAGWLAEIEVAAPPAGLLSADDYRQITA
jgi:glycine cleavage system H lipoate-binding protein